VSANPAGPLEVDRSLLTLRPPPRPDPVTLAVVAAAVEMAWPRTAAPGEGQATEPEAWRFSGRWWHKPVPVRRDRPWARP
jgi:hypothetical protein